MLGTPASMRAPAIRGEILRASTSGVAATVPMTLVMLGLHQAFPEERERPVVPHELTMRATGPIGVPQHLGPLGRRALTTLGHFGYGGAAGGLYALWERVVPGPPALNGALFGLAVWGGSYLGWVPSLGLMSPATRQPWERNAVMIAAHLVWGALLAVAVDRWRRAGRSPGPRPTARSNSEGIAPPR